MTAVGTLHAVAGLRIGEMDVLIRTNSVEFAAAADGLFADLRRPSTGLLVGLVVFDVLRRDGLPVEWSVWRDGEPCEAHVQDDAVLSYVQWELCRLFIESNPMSIHAACVADGGRAVILAGESHSGKTTLAGWLACVFGFGLLSDEVAAVDGDGRVLPFPRPLGVRAESPLAGLPGAGVVAGERLVPVSALGGRLADRAASPALIVFPRFEVGASSVCRRVGQADTLERLAVLTPGLQASGRLVFDRMVRLVSSVPAVEVVHGDVDVAARLVVDMLDAS